MISGNLFRKIIEVLHFRNKEEILRGANIVLKYFCRTREMLWYLYIVENHVDIDTVSSTGCRCGSKSLES